MLLLDELHVDDSLEALIGAPLHKLRRHQYPQAIAIALILRHSWRADDLTCVLERLGIRV